MLLFDFEMISFLLFKFSLDIRGILFFSSILILIISFLFSSELIFSFSSLSNWFSLFALLLSFSLILFLILKSVSFFAFSIGSIFLSKFLLIFSFLFGIFKEEEDKFLFPSSCLIIFFIFLLLGFCKEFCASIFLMTLGNFIFIPLFIWFLFSISSLLL